MAIRALLLTAVLASGAARAGSQQDALAAIDALLFDFKFPAAEAALGKLLAQPNLSRPVLLRVLELQGVVAASRNNTAKARSAFRTLIALDPDHQLEGKYAPRVTTPFFEAKAWLSVRGSLAFLPTPAKFQGERVEEIGAELKNDPLSLASAVRFHFRPPRGEWSEASVSVTAPGPVRIAAAGSPDLEWWAELLGARAAVLVELGSAAAPRVERVAPPPQEPPPPPPPPAQVSQALEPPRGPPAPAAPLADLGPVAPGPRSSLRPWAIATGAAAALGLGGGLYFGYQSQTARDRIATAASGPKDAQGHVFGVTEAEAQSLDARARGNAQIANAAFGAAIAAGVATALLLVFGGER